MLLLGTLTNSQNQGNQGTNQQNNVNGNVGSFNGNQTVNQTMFDSIMSQISKYSGSFTSLGITATMLVGILGPFKNSVMKALQNITHFLMILKTQGLVSAITLLATGKAFKDKDTENAGSEKTTLS